MTTTTGPGRLGLDTTRPGRGRFVHVVAVPPGADRLAVEPLAWRETVAPIGAWGPATAYRPVLEQRLWRGPARGPLRHTIAVVLHDPLQQLDERAARVEADELLRPVAERRRLVRLPARALAAYHGLRIEHVAELAEADPYLPEGGDAFGGLFHRLVSGLAAVPGHVALSMLVAPARELPPDRGLAAAGDILDALDDRERGVPSRQVEFRLRILTEHPVPATLLARAEALCLAHPPMLSSWRCPVNRHQLDAARAAVAAATLDDWSATGTRPTVNPRIAALTFALVESPPGGRTVDGSPYRGPLARTGAVLGRVARPDGRRAPWRLDWERRRLHVLLAGSSGCGKTTTIKRLALDDLTAGRAVVLVDPHGDVATEVAALVPTDRLVHIDPRLTGSAALDLLDPDPTRAAAHLMAAVREIWPADYAGPSWNRGISLALRGLHAAPGFRRRPTLADVERFVTQHAWRAELVGGITDRPLRADLEHEHAVWATEHPGHGGGPSMVQYLAAKFAPLTQGPARRLFSTPPGPALETELARGAVVVVALPLGTLGTESTRLVTRMFLSRLTAAIAAQGERTEADRRPVAVYCDEAHLMAGGALGGLFAQARKFATAVHVAVQAPSMLGRHLDEIATNTQTHLLGRLPHTQAAHLLDRAGAPTLRVLPTLPRHHLAVITEDHDPDADPVVLTPVPPPG